MNPITVIHLSVLVGILIPIPFGSLLLPYIYWRIRRKKENDLFSIQARNILNFQALFCILFYVGLVVLWYVFLQNIWNGTLPNYAMMAYPVAALLAVNIVYPIFIACHRNIQKKYYHTIRWFLKS